MPQFRDRVLALTALPLAILVGGCAHQSKWQLIDIRDHLPGLQFSLSTHGNNRLSAADFHGKVTLLYFGYLHCPDVCPMTMAQLGGVVRQLGPLSSDLRILFVSVDPRRDTPEAVAKYARAFTPLAVGATGTAEQIEALAKRYRVAYQAQDPDPDGNYEVMHSKIVYVFDRAGKARLLIDDTSKPGPIVHDLRELLTAD